MNYKQYKQLLERAGKYENPNGEQMYVMSETYVTAMLLQAVKSERDACAKLCKDMYKKWERNPNRLIDDLPTAENCAQAIRARGQE